MRPRWKTYGFDKARANMHILRTTGKYGKLESTDEVWEYCQRIDSQPKDSPTPQPKAKQPQKRQCGLAAGRLVALKAGEVKIYTVTAEGTPQTLVDTKTTDKQGSGRAWRCDDCKKAFTEWVQFVDHSLVASKPSIDTPTNHHAKVKKSARAAKPSQRSRRKAMPETADTEYDETTNTQVSTDNHRRPGSDRPGNNGPERDSPGGAPAGSAATAPPAA